MTSHQSKYALVTGASSGIGFEYAQQLAAAGYGVILVGNRADENEAAAQRIAAEYKVEVWPLYADLAADTAAEVLFAQVRARGFEVEILICNAGMLLFGALTAVTPERLRQIVALHCTTPMQLCRLFGNEMRRRGQGRILLMASATAWMPYPTIAAYAATKSFLLTFGRALHEELRPHRVTVTTIFPGAVDTPFYDLSDRWRRRLVRFGVMSTPRSVAHSGLKALFKGRRQCIPGCFTKLCVAACRILPVCALRPLLRLNAVKRLL